ncbi:high affinity immunoglobulin epsilon receptor subunit gamma [Bufo gargarizans]|uniref:high affinity immunoglobulin epsilon receptor subunit gamma n=1 Tax=Bufo gargarizans TaxID=30331 RepID=UPI001CF1A3D5|nr:high affinity immunoglobulin epsilon receptor subunit gamma [Bufo gargarizans]
MQEPEICYILDGILFLYGIVLTALYCHLKVKTARAKKAAARGELYEHLKSPDKQIYSEIGKGETEMALKGAEGIYTGLGPTEKATYETLHCLEKKSSPIDA